jgi:hypothetical protein
MPYQVPSSHDTLNAVFHTISDLALRSHVDQPAFGLLWRAVDSATVRADALGVIGFEPKHPKFLMEFV